MNLVRSAIVLGFMLSAPVWAADHLDSPLVRIDPAADINDLYAFVNPNDPDELVLIATVSPIAGENSRFSDVVEYRFNVRNLTSGASYLIGCRALGRKSKGMRCQLAGTEAVAGPLERINVNDSGDLRLFAGLRDDPFFFDLAAYLQTVDNVVSGDSAPIAFENPGTDFFAPLNTLAIAIGIDRNLLTDSGNNPLLAVWASTHLSSGGPLRGSAGQGADNSHQIDRMGRAGINTVLIDLLGLDASTPPLTDQYNIAENPADWSQFIPEMTFSLTALDTIDGAPGNTLFDALGIPLDYAARAGVLAADFLLIDVSEPSCGAYLAVEVGLFGIDLGACGGRTLEADVIDVTLSAAVANGASDFVDDSDNVYLPSFPFISDAQ